MAKKRAIAMAKIVAAIHQTLIPSLSTGIPPFHKSIEMRWYAHLPQKRAILIPDQIVGVLYLFFNVSSIS
jgi:hypothetical protein